MDQPEKWQNTTNPTSSCVCVNGVNVMRWSYNVKKNLVQIIWLGLNVMGFMLTMTWFALKINKDWIIHNFNCDGIGPVVIVFATIFLNLQSNWWLWFVFINWFNQFIVIRTLKWTSKYTNYASHSYCGFLSPFQIVG